MDGTKGYFSGPEGKVNATTWGLVGLGLAVVVYLMGGAVGDYLVSAADNTMHLVIVGCALAFVLAALMDPKKRMWYVYRGVIRWLMSFWINLDPIGIRQSYVERLKAKQEKFIEAVGTLRGQLIGMKRDAASNQMELERHEALFKEATKVGDQRAQVSNSKDMQRCQILAKQYAGGIENLTKMQSVVVRYQEICSDEIHDKESDILFRQKQMKLTKATGSISGAIRGILTGLPEKDLYDEAGNVLDTMYDQTLGEFDNALDITKDVLSNANLADGAALQAALSRFENNNSKVLVGKTTKEEVLRQIPAAIPVPRPTTTTDYSDFLQ